MSQGLILHFISTLLTKSWDCSSDCKCSNDFFTPFASSPFPSLSGYLLILLTTALMLNKVNTVGEATNPCQFACHFTKPQMFPGHQAIGHYDGANSTPWGELRMEKDRILVLDSKGAYLRNNFNEPRLLYLPIYRKILLKSLTQDVWFLWTSFDMQLHVFFPPVKPPINPGSFLDSLK